MPRFRRRLQPMRKKKRTSMLKLDAEHVHNLSKRIRDLSGEDVTHCIQCGKCSGGCTVAPDMEEIPSRIMRFIQLNMKERALTSSMVWTCTSCLTCTARCPEGIDIAKVMNVLRMMCTAEGYTPKEKQIHVFNRLFIGMIQKYGHVYELGLMVKNNMMAMTPFSC
ncbi:MAG: heterodisulfide reductase subunit C [Syntrophobacterales bacterium CG03_land_8_20_14_0_80_58_14]|nr:MAG: heterodisulfide reductase subunit C [Syntrophobacterales bacterium CG03_land_8_20_14_0_80_58_14]